MQTNILSKSAVIVALAAFATTTHSQPVILACDTQFVGCVKELDGRSVCTSPRLQKNTIELKNNSIRHLDDYGYFGYKNCEVSEAMISCGEDVEPSVYSSSRDTRRLTIERTTGRLDSSIDVELGSRNGVAPKQKGWLNKYTGYCAVRQNKNLL